jgi:hypothetical protein
MLQVVWADFDGDGDRARDGPMATATALAMATIGISFRPCGYYLGLLIFVISHDRFGSG